MPDHGRLRIWNVTAMGRTFSHQRHVGLARAGVMLEVSTKVIRDAATHTQISVMVRLRSVVQRGDVNLLEALFSAALVLS